MRTGAAGPLRRGKRITVAAAMRPLRRPRPRASHRQSPRLVVAGDGGAAQREGKRPRRGRGLATTAATRPQQRGARACRPTPAVRAYGLPALSRYVCLRSPVRLDRAGAEAARGGRPPRAARAAVLVPNGPRQRAYARRRRRDVCAISRRDAARDGATCITALDAGARRAGRAFSEMARGASAGRDAAARDCKRLRRVARSVRAIAGEWASRRGRISRRCPQAARRCACCPEVPAPTIITAPLLHAPDREV